RGTDTQQADADDRRFARRRREGAGAAAARRGEGAVILVIAEQRDGKLNRATWEAVAAAQQLAGTAQQLAGDKPISIAVLAAQVKPQGGTPAIITVQIGAFRADAVKKGGSANVKKVDVAIDASAIRQKPEAPFREAKQAVDLGQAERIVAVGRGIKSQENIPIAEKLAKAMNAEIAASRPICDNGWLPMERQGGSSGQTLSPKLDV